MNDMQSQTDLLQACENVIMFGDKVYGPAYCVDVLQRLRTTLGSNPPNDTAKPWWHNSNTEAEK